jgi:hypothetical protein
MEPGPLEEEVELHPGDLIYLPRGFMHSASTKKATSLHLTVGAVPVTWASVILRAVEACIEQEPGFRASLPPRFATEGTLQKKCEAQFVDIMHLLVERADAGSAIRNATEMASLGQRRERLEGRLLDLEAESEIGLETRLRRRPGVHWSLAREDDYLMLSFNGKVVRMPAYVQREVEALTQLNDFKPVALAGDLDEAGTLVLVRRLLREGFLTICR